MKLCVIGWHKWLSISPLIRKCEKCGRFELLEFYSNRTQKWVAKEKA
jgi:hypothetical protein